MKTFSSSERAIAEQQAGVLAKALPWLLKFHGATVVLKYGGNAMTDQDLQRAFAQDVVFLRLAGLNPVVVHGGGPQISDMLQRLEVPSEFKGGYRVTSSQAMDVVRMVLTGQVQREIVSLINEHGPFAVGVSGEDAHLFTAKRRTADHEGERIDIGYVGDVADVRPDFVKTLIDDGLIPVVSSVGMDDSGDPYNINADSAAAALAASLEADKFVLLTDVEGLYANWPSTADVIRTLELSELQPMLENAESGMVPKLQACADAVGAGVPRAHIIDGRIQHSLLVEVFTDEGVGTMVVPDGEGDR